MKTRAVQVYEHELVHVTRSIGGTARLDVCRQVRLPRLLAEQGLIAAGLSVGLLVYVHVWRTGHAGYPPMFWLFIVLGVLVLLTLLTLRLALHARLRHLPVLLEVGPQLKALGETHAGHLVALEYSSPFPDRIVTRSRTRHLFVHIQEHGHCVRLLLAEIEPNGVRLRVPPAITDFCDEVGVSVVTSRPSTEAGGPSMSP